MLVQPTQVEGASSERLSDEQPSPSPTPTGEIPYESLPDSSSAQPSEVPFEHHPDTSPSPSPKPSPTPIIPDSIPEPSSENLGDHSSNDASLSGNEDDMTLQNVYDLCISLCQQVSDQAKEIKHLKAKIKKLKKKAKPVIKHYQEYLKITSLQQRFPKKSFSKKQRVHKKNVSKQGRKKAKGKSSVQRDLMFEVLAEDKSDHMETENAQTEGRTRDMVEEEKEFDEDRLSTEDEVSTVKEGVSTNFEKVSTDRPKVSIDESKVSTDKQVEGTDESNESTEEIFEGTEDQREGTEDKVSTDEQMESTEDQSKEENASKASQTSTQTPTSMTFGDDKTIATLLIDMSKAKAASKEKEKGVELKDVEEIDRPRPTSTRSLLTLKPLPKIDPKDKGKKKIEEEDESESEDDDIPQLKIEATEFGLRSFQEHERSSSHRKRAKFLHDNNVLRENSMLQQDQRHQKQTSTMNQLRKSDDDILKHKDSPKEKRSAGNLNMKSRKRITEEENTERGRMCTRKKMKSRKRRFKQDTSQDDPSDIEKENDELRLCLTIAPDEDKEVDYEILDKKYPIIDWKNENLGTKPQFDESKRSEEINMNVCLDSEDLDAIYKLVMDIYQDKIPEGFDKVLWGDLIVMFNLNEQDEFWNSQHEWKVVSWKLHSSSEVHTLMTDEGLVIYMLIVKKYPLIKEIVMQMLKLKLESEEKSTMALELIRFIKKVLADLESKE
ncbi:hypothetical protein Tco_0885248 [Tanacetum coccineum]